MSGLPTAFSRETLRAKPWLKWAIALTVSLGALLEVIDTSIVNVALADMQASFGATLGEIGWIVTGYAMANVIIIPLSAWLGDYFGKKRYFVFSMVAFVLASVLCGTATSLPMLVAARILQGLAGGGLLAKAQSILFETFPKEEHGIAQAVFGVGVIVGPTIGPTLGGYLTTNFSWPWIFFVNVPVGIVAIFMSLTFLPEDPKAREVSSKVDWLGIGLLATTLGSLQWLLERGNEEDWFESRLISTLAAVCLVGGASFVWRELTVPHPAVNLRVLRHKSVAAGSTFSALLGMGLYGALFAVPIFAQEVLHFTSMQVGVLLIPGALAAGINMPIMGRMIGRVDARIMITCGALVTSGVMFALARINTTMGQEAFFWPLVFRGFGISMMFLPLSVATIGPVPRKDIGAASGFYNLTRQLGGSVGIAILTSLISQRAAYHVSRLSEHVSAYDAGTQQRLSQIAGALSGTGSDAATAGQQALQILEGAIRVQATTLSFADAFRIGGVAFLFSLPLVFFLGRGTSKQAPTEAH